MDIVGFYMCERIELYYQKKKKKELRQYVYVCVREKEVERNKKCRHYV